VIATSDHGQYSLLDYISVLPRSPPAKPSVSHSTSAPITSKRRAVDHVPRHARSRAFYARCSARGALRPRPGHLVVAARRRRDADDHEADPTTLRAAKVAYRGCVEQDRQARGQSDRVKHGAGGSSVVPRNNGGDARRSGVGARPARASTSCWEKAYCCRPKCWSSGCPRRPANGLSSRRQLDRARPFGRTRAGAVERSSAGDVVLAAAASGRVLAMLDDPASAIPAPSFDTVKSGPVRRSGRRRENESVLGDEAQGARVSRCSGRASSATPTGQQHGCPSSMNYLRHMTAGRVPDLTLIIKADCKGPRRRCRTRSRSFDLRGQVNIVHSPGGGIPEKRRGTWRSASRAVIVFFNVRRVHKKTARKLAESSGSTSATTNSSMTRSPT